MRHALMTIVLLPLLVTVQAFGIDGVTIWPASALPAVTDSNDPNPVELGVRFRSTVAGYITGIRFYKAPLNTGIHAGNLWTNSGNLLATGTFANETASGWQQVNFPTPVPIDANVTYVASYHTNTGHYSYSAPYFASSGYPSGNDALLYALQDGADGANGVYSYSATSTFPTAAFGNNGLNYWVDVVFLTSIPADTTPPSVTATTPTAAGIEPGTLIQATFSESINMGTLNSSTFQLLDASNNMVAAGLTYDSDSLTATLLPSSPLATSTTYTAVVKGGNGIQDLAGNLLASDYRWSFTTGAPLLVSPDSAPGGPILVVTSTTNPFTVYLAEILRNEGFNEFAIANVVDVTATTLQSYDLVVLGEMSLTDAQAGMFTAWVDSGGKLIAMRPDRKLANLFGLADTGSTLRDGYLAVNTTSGPGVGITDQTIQYHWDADLYYMLAGATTLATLCSDATTLTCDHPAVVVNNVGSSGGQAAAFTFDLARSVAYTRQGDPEWAGKERDGTAPIRSNDLYYGGSAPDYVDLSKVSIPQADEQMRLFANMILDMSIRRKPLPRFWYFPRGVRAVVVMTGDDHGAGGASARFQEYVSDSPANCSVADWQCIRSTAYVFPGTPFAGAAEYLAKGFEIALHPETSCGDYTYDSLDLAFTTQLTQWRAYFQEQPSPVTSRTHCIPWSDWISHAQVELKHGVRLDTNYYYWPGAWILDRPGFFTGSGMPMRFVTQTGEMVDVYQAATQLTDESEQTYPMTIDILLDNAVGPLGYFGVFTANAHTDVTGSADVSQAIVNSARTRGVPIVSARQMLTWLDGRNASSFGSIASSGATLTFNIRVGIGARNLQAMLPANSTAGPLIELTMGNASVSYKTATIKGVAYAFFDALPGNYAAIYERATTTTTVAASPNPSTFGQTTTITAKVTGAGATGTMTFVDGATTLDTMQLDPSGQAAYTSNTLAAGKHTITALYSGDANFLGSRSGAVTLTVNKVASTTTLTSSANPSSPGQMVTFTAAVSGVGSAPTGTILLKDGSQNLAVVTLDSSGQATYSTSHLSTGSHQMKAAYSGDTNYNASAAPNLTQNVVKTTAVITAFASPAPSVSGQLVTFTATVTAGSGTPTGTVAFREGKSNLGSGTLNSAGQVSLSTSSLSIGLHTITAIYGGDAYFASGSTQFTQQVNAANAKAATTTLLSSSLNPSRVGQAVTFTATVTGVGGTPTGTLRFKDGKNILGSVPLDPSGTANITITNLLKGSHSITGTYNGDTQFAGSVSALLTQTVQR